MSVSKRLEYRLGNVFDERKNRLRISGTKKYEESEIYEG